MPEIPLDPPPRTEDLLSRSKGGDAEAWSQLYRRYFKMLVAFVRLRLPQYTHRSFDAEDILNDAFITAMTRVDGFEYRGEGSFRRWMQKLVINEFLDQLKRHNRKAGLSAGTQELHGQIGDAPTPSENLRKDEEEDRLRSSLERLEETDREILTMHFYGKMKIKEIAEVMGWHRNKTRDRLDESISRLQRLMSP